MCVSHAQISYFHRPYVMERMQNGGSGLTVFGRAFMPCVEEISSQLYKVELKQVMKSLDAWHQLKDKLAKIGPSITEEVDLIGEEETTVMAIPARKDALLVFKESIELKKEGMLLFNSASTESVYQDKATLEEIWTREMRTDQMTMTVAKDVPEHQTTTNQQCYISAKHVKEESSYLSKKEIDVWKKEGNQYQSFIPSDESVDQHIFTFDHEQIKVIQESVMGRESRDQTISEYMMEMAMLATVSGRNKSAENEHGVIQPSNPKLGPVIMTGLLHDDVTIRIRTSRSESIEQLEFLLKREVKVQEGSAVAGNEQSQMKQSTDYQQHHNDTSNGDEQRFGLRKADLENYKASDRSRTGGGVAKTAAERLSWRGDPTMLRSDSVTTMLDCAPPGRRSGRAGWSDITTATPLASQRRDRVASARARRSRSVDRPTATLPSGGGAKNTQRPSSSTSAQHRTTSRMMNAEEHCDLGETAQTTRPWGGSAPNAMLLPGGVAVKLQGQHNSAPEGVARPHHRGGDAMSLGRTEAVRLMFSDAGRSQNLDKSGGTTAAPRRDATAYDCRSRRTRDRGRDHKDAARPSQRAAAQPSKRAAALVFRQGMNKEAKSGQLRSTRPQPRQCWGTAWTANYLTGSRRRRGLRYARHGLPRTTQSGGVFEP
jgi:hypothetical protein